MDFNLLSRTLLPWSYKTPALGVFLLCLCAAPRVPAQVNFVLYCSSDSKNQAVQPAVSSSQPSVSSTLGGKNQLL